MDTILEMIARGWEDFLARPDGPVSFRFTVQPIMATILAIRAGVRDARAGRPPFFWGMLTHAGQRRKLLYGGLKELRNLFILGVVLDVIYQLSVHRFIYPLELVFTVTLLVFVPYLLIRGPANRVARLYLRRRQRDGDTSSRQ